MNKQEAIEKIKALGPKDAVHCPTKEEAVEFCRLMHEAGLMWCDSGIYLDNTDWNVYAEYTVYCPSEKCYANTEFYLERRGYTIHPASDFLGGEEEEKFTDKDSDVINEGLDRLYGKKETNLHSSVNQMGETVTQILHFSGGNKRTIDGVITNTIKQGEMTKFKTIKGVMWMINTANVDCVEIFTDNG